MSNIIVEQQKYFESWKSFMEASIGQRLCLERERNLPWLIFPRQYDQFYLTIEGHEIVGWGASLPYADELIHCDGDDSRYVAGVVEDGRALQMLVDPRTVQYTQSHNGAGDDPRPNPGWLVLRAIEPFFKDWKKKAPARLERVFMQIKEERLVWLDQQIRRDIDTCRNYENHLKEANKNIRQHRQAQIALRHISSKHFTEVSENWQGMIDSMGEISIVRPNLDSEPTKLQLTMPGFEINDVALGPYEISLDLGELYVSVINVGHTKSHNGYHHPHVDTEGNICWGEQPRTIIDVINRANPLEILFCVADFLKTSYTANGAHCRLDAWEGEGTDTWYCEFCDERHEDDNNCPQWCGECEDHTNNWSEHHSCGEHYKCWNEANLPRDHREENAEECPECREGRLGAEAEAREEEREQEQAREEAEREAEDEEDNESSTPPPAAAEVAGASEDESDDDDIDEVEGNIESDGVNQDPDEDPPRQQPEGYDNDCSCVACERFRQAQDQTAAE